MAIDDVAIGNFTRPVVPRTEPARPSPEDAAAALGDAATATETELAPMKAYEDALKEIKVSKEDAALIVDAILRKGFWSEEVLITKTLKARFRTRSSRDRARAMTYIEGVRPMFEAHVQELMNKQLLAASLEMFGDDKFAHPDPRVADATEVERAFDARFRFVDAVIPDPALSLLLARFLKFEDKIRVVMQEGVVENF